MTDITELPTADERLVSASNTSDLTVDPERRRPIDVLIAQGLAKSAVGGFLAQIVSDWDGSSRVRRLNEAEVRKLAECMPRRVVTKRRASEDVVDIEGARKAAGDWYEAERRKAVLSLKTLPKLTNPHFGLIAWLAAHGAVSTEAVLVDVLCWYVDRQCPACSGTKWAVAAGTNRQTGKVCSGCSGAGVLPIPHGRLGKDVVWHMEDCVNAARGNRVKVMKNMQHVKHWAAARCM